MNTKEERRVSRGAIYFRSRIVRKERVAAKERRKGTKEEWLNEREKEGINGIRERRKVE